MYCSLIKLWHLDWNVFIYSLYIFHHSLSKMYCRFWCVPPSMILEVSFFPDRSWHECQTKSSSSLSTFSVFTNQDLTNTIFISASWTTWRYVKPPRAIQSRLEKHHQMEVQLEDKLQNRRFIIIFAISCETEYSF